MTILTTEAGPLPVGLWIVVAYLASTTVFGVAAQGLSVLAWDRAMALGLQEDDPHSADPMERGFFAVEWGLALADAVVQTLAVLLAVYGLVAQHWVGLLGVTVLCTIHVHYSLAYWLRCRAIGWWRLGDWTRWRRTAVIFLTFGQGTGWLGLIGLWSNWRYFVA